MKPELCSKALKLTIFPCSTFPIAALQTHTMFPQTRMFSCTVITLDLTHMFTITHRERGRRCEQDSFLLRVSKVCTQLCKKSFYVYHNAAFFSLGNLLQFLHSKRGLKTLLQKLCAPSSANTLGLIYFYGF